MKNKSKKIILSVGIFAGVLLAGAYSVLGQAYTWQTIGGATGKFYNGTNPLDAVYTLGKVGVGTTTPEYDLHVVGTTNLGGKFVTGTLSTDAVYTDGNVGVGTASPVESITIEGDPSPGLVLFTTGAGARQAHVRFGDNATYKWQWRYNPDVGDKLLAYSWTLGADVMALDATGKVGILTNTPAYELDINGTIRAIAFIYTSDERLKTNISDLQNSSDILKISPKNFDWKDQDKKGVVTGDIGLIAQDVEKYFPQFVTQDDNGYKAVDYSKLVAPLIGIAKEQQAEIDNLKAEIQEIKELLK